VSPPRAIYEFFQPGTRFAAPELSTAAVRVATLLTTGRDPTASRMPLRHGRGGGCRREDLPAKLARLSL